MFAKVGDKLVVHGLHVDRPDRYGEILDVRGPEGTPPFVVRWESDGHEALVCPGPDASILHITEEHESSTIQVWSRKV